MLKENLIKFGLSKKEAEVYLSLLSAGISAVSSIAEQAKLNRSTTYVLLDSLQKKGLVSVSDDGGVRSYAAAPPSRLVHLLEESISKYSELLDTANLIVPKLNEIQNTETKKPRNIPKIQLYDGVQGIKNVYEDMLETDGDICTYASINDIHPLLPKYFPKYLKRREESGLKARIIFPDTKKGGSQLKFLLSNTKNHRTLPTNEYSFTPEINIYGEKVAFMSIKEKFGLIIENPEISTVMKAIFEVSWMAASAPTKKTS